MTKKLSFILLLLSVSVMLSAQELQQLSLTDAYTLLEGRYPLLRSGDLLSAIYDQEMEQLDIARRPSIFVNGDGRFQSQSTSLDAGDSGMLPFTIDQPLVSIKAYGEANYTILDGGLNDAQRIGKQAKLKVDQQNLELESFALRQRINHFFLNITLLREQIDLISISEKDLTIRIEQVAAGVEFGAVLPSELTRLEVKALELKAQKENIFGNIKALTRGLADLVGKDLNHNIELIYPSIGAPTEIPNIKRPETTLFKYQREAVQAQSVMIEVAKKPKLSAFAQAGLGYPNPLNILDNNVAPFGLIGARFSWKILDWKKGEVDREILNLKVQKINTVEDNFLFNIKSKEANYLAQVERLEKQILLDQEIAKLQAEILKQLGYQLDEGIITSADYVNQVDAELLALQKLEIHKTELLKTQIEFWSERGGF